MNKYLEANHFPSSFLKSSLEDIFTIDFRDSGKKGEERREREKH